MLNFFVMNKVGYQLYCMEGIKMRQLVLGPQTFIVRILINLNLRNIVIFIQERKEGEKGERSERQRESVCERWSVAETGVGIRSKNGHWRKD
jgi:hypothetical protein